MKTRTWILIFVCIALFCTIFSLALVFNKPQTNQALIYFDGKPVKTISLLEDGEYRIGDGKNWNLLIVSKGKIHVEASSCSSKDCIHQGASNGGAPIICLPNRLVIEFSNSADYDALLR